MLEARDARSVTIDSGLEPYEVTLIIDDRRDSEKRESNAGGAAGRDSMKHLFEFI